MNEFNLKSITNRNNDFYGSRVNGMPTPLYYYYFNEDMMNKYSNLDVPMTVCPSIISVLYVPFIDESQLDLYNIPYDQKRYGSINNTDPTDYTIPCSVFRVRGESRFGLSRVIATITRDTMTNNNTPVLRDWRNESKLQYYPYTYRSLTDYMNAPLMIKTQYITGVNVDICIEQTLSDRATYNLFLRNYKGDTNGQTEGIISSVPLDLPTSSSAYSQFIATSKASFMNSNMVANNNETVGRQRLDLEQFDRGRQNLMNNLGGALGSALSLNIGGAFTGGMQYGYNKSMNKQRSDQENLEHSTSVKNRISTSVATVNDIMNTPRNASIGSGDVMQHRALSNRRLDVITYEMQDEYKRRVSDYFAMYGYKQNKIMRVDYTSRKHYNYIKTIGANIDGALPKGVLDEIRNIFDKGITFWHIENKDGVDIGNYKYDNKEVF